ncbi:hypothetical protein D3C86_1103930 [compost metagenome]
MALLLGIHVSPSESIRNVMSPPSRGVSAATALRGATVDKNSEAEAAKEAVKSSRRRDRENEKERFVMV